MTRILCIALLCVLSSSLSAQNNPFTDSLKRNLDLATSSAEKVKWLGYLSNFYFPLDRKLSDDYSLRQTRLAEESRDRKLIVLAILSDARRHYNFSANQDNINAGIKFSQRALDLARSASLDEEQAWSYLYLAEGSRLNGDNDKALNYNNLALSITTTQENDSLSVEGYNAIGHTYLNKNEKMLAFRNYLHALSIAEESDKYFLLRYCYVAMANFYSDLNDFEKAKDYMYKYLQITKRFGYRLDRLDVYNSLGRIYANNKQLDIATSFYEKSIALADTLKFELVKINSYSRLLTMYMANYEGAKTLEFFNTHPTLRTFMETAGFGYIIDQVYGTVHASINNFDSAYYYLKRAEPVFEARASRSNRLGFYTVFASFYKKKKDYPNALVYLKKAQQISREIKDMETELTVNQNLDTLYQRIGDYKNAYLYNRRYQQLKDSIDQLSADKDLMLLEVENENKRKEKQQLQEEEMTRARHNIQYMGITAAIAGVFILLVMFGIFSVSPATIRILGFFAFIFLFEFIILLADNQIHHWTHGEPWKILAIKIALISILLPLHHFLEEKVIHYLTSRKMLELNRRTILSRFSKKNPESTSIES